MIDVITTPKGRTLEVNSQQIEALLGVDDKDWKEFSSRYDVDLDDVAAALDRIKAGAVLRGGSPNCVLVKTGEGKYRTASDFDDELPEAEVLETEGYDIDGDATLTGFLIVFSADAGPVLPCVEDK